MPEDGNKTPGKHRAGAEVRKPTLCPLDVVGEEKDVATVAFNKRPASVPTRKVEEKLGGDPAENSRTHGLREGNPALGYEDPENRKDNLARNHLDRKGEKKPPRSEIREEIEYCLHPTAQRPAPSHLVAQNFVRNSYA